jgi:hypothetical protein
LLLLYADLRFLLLVCLIVFLLCLYFFIYILSFAPRLIDLPRFYFFFLKRFCSIDFFL